MATFISKGNIVGDPPLVRFVDLFATLKSCEYMKVSYSQECEGLKED